MAVIFTHDDCTHQRARKGLRFELPVPGSSQSIAVFIAREFEGRLPPEAHAERIRSGRRQIMLFPIKGRRRAQADWVFAIDRFDAVNGEIAFLDRSRTQLSLVDVDNPTHPVELRYSYASLGFAVLLGDGDRIVSSPFGDGRVWVAWNSEGEYTSRLMSADEYGEVFESTADEEDEDSLWDEDDEWGW